MVLVPEDSSSKHCRNVSLLAGEVGALGYQLLADPWVNMVEKICASTPNISPLLFLISNIRVPK